MSTASDLITKSKATNLSSTASAVQAIGCAEGSAINMHT